MIAGRYTLDREIGRGGMGAVWLGRDEVLHRDVALKRIGLTPGASAPDLERAQREGRLAARLNHPHVVAVYDLVEEEGARWLVMEYVEGASLAQVIRADGPMTSERASQVLWQTADALAAAHSAGIVHRDVKPSNILLTVDGQAKLTDFGIARAEADASLTQTGLVTGSPAYLSPEVASGQVATPAADVWSLGATLFHALSGRPPYDVGENVLGAMYKIVNEPPPRLAGAGPLAPLLENTMATDPAHRWSMAQVRDFLAERGSTVPRPIPAVATAPLEDATDRTDVLTATPMAPVPPVAPPVTPAPAPAPPDSSGSRRSRAPWVLVAVGLVLVAALAFAAIQLAADDPETTPTAGEQSSSAPAPSPTPSPSETPSETPSPTPSETPSETPTASPSESESAEETEEPPPPDDAAAMESFVTSYLATVTSDPRSTWSRLTPGFQEASGGFGRYKGFWDTVESATVRDVRPDPSTLAVTYDVDYVTASGTSSETVTLQLVRSGDSFLIADEY